MDFPFGYSTQRVTLEQLRTKSTFRNAHPELRRRVEAMMIASGGSVGVGTMWRDPVAQDRERARRLATHTGAQMAPSSRSWHCAGGAIDVVGNQRWARDNCHHFGLYYATWAGESLWHQQLAELPHARPTGASVDQFVGHHEIVNPPGAPVVEPHPAGFPPFNPAACQFSLWPLSGVKPVVRIGFHGDAAAYAQGVIRCKGGPDHQIPVDGVWGRTSAWHLMAFQNFFGLHADGWLGPQTWAMIDRLASQ